MPDHFITFSTTPQPFRPPCDPNAPFDWSIVAIPLCTIPTLLLYTYINSKAYSFAEKKLCGQHSARVKNIGPKKLGKQFQTSKFSNLISASGSAAEITLCLGINTLFQSNKTVAQILLPATVLRTMWLAFRHLTNTTHYFYGNKEKACCHHCVNIKNKKDLFVSSTILLTYIMTTHKTMQIAFNES